jgi:hypothetical protein
MTTRPVGSAEKAASELYQAYMTGLILTLVTRRSTDDAARWIEALFRRQHEEKFLAGLDKLGLKDKPDAIACAGYHYLANKIGGVDVEFMAESDKKAWVRFVPPRWIYSGAAICGVPSEVSRGILRGWYGRNGITLGNPRLGFVCTAQTMDGQHGLAGYFLEYDRDLRDDERLVFRPGETPPSFDPDKALAWSEADWPAKRLAKARRNYAIDYIRSGLVALVEMVGPAETAYYGSVTGRLIGAQYFAETAGALGCDTSGGGSAEFAHFMATLAKAEGDTAEIEPGENGAVLIRRSSTRLFKGLDQPHPALFDAWCGLFHGALSAYDRTMVLEVLARRDYGDDADLWRIRPGVG